MSDRERNVLRNSDEFTVEHTWKDDRLKQHMYDRVFDGHATQDDVFEDTKASLIKFCVVGRESTLISLSNVVVVSFNAVLSTVCC